MPMRVKSKPQPGANDPPRSPSPTMQRFSFHGLPDVRDGDTFREVIKKLSMCVLGHGTHPRGQRHTRLTYHVPTGI